MPKILKNRVFIFILQRRRLEFPVIIYENGGGAAESLGCRRRRLRNLKKFFSYRRQRRLSHSAYTSRHMRF